MRSLAACPAADWRTRLARRAGWPGEGATRALDFLTDTRQHSLFVGGHSAKSEDAAW